MFPYVSTPGTGSVVVAGAWILWTVEKNYILMEKGLGRGNRKFGNLYLQIATFAAF